MKVKLIKALTVNVNNPYFEKSSYEIGEEIEVSDAVAASLRNGKYIAIEAVEVVEEKPVKRTTRKKKVSK